MPDGLPVRWRPKAPRRDATEYTFSSYGLGGTAFGAGVTPPPGTYVSTATIYYRGKISGSIDIGGIVFEPAPRWSCSVSAP